jgi:acetylglutamate kinase
VRAEDIDGLIEEGVIKSGMIPKARAAKSAVLAGVKKAHIIDGRIPHSILLEIFTDEGIGTEVTE